MSDACYDSTSKMFATDAGQLHYHEAGEGYPLLMLHGSGPGVSAWANFGNNLRVFEPHFRTLLLDLPGFGRSYAPEGPLGAAALDAVGALLDGLGLDSVAIVGNSMGGNVASRFAAQEPDRVTRLVTMGGVGLPLLSPSPPEGIKLLVAFVEKPTREALLAWMESMVFDPSVLTDELIEMRWESATDPEVLGSIRKMYNNAMLEGMRARDNAGLTSIEYLTRITAPTLLTWGRDDRVTPLDSALIPLRLIRNCELHTFPNCGHWAMIERKREFESAVLAFLLRDD